MADKATLDAIQAARQEAREQAKAVVADPNSTPEAIAEAQKDLDDPVVQDEIMNPVPKLTELSYCSITLHPLSARMERKYHGFATSVLASAAQRRNVIGSSRVGTLQIKACLVEEDPLIDGLMYYTAIATGEPGKVSEAEAAKLMIEFDNNLKIDDCLILFSTLGEITGFLDGAKATKVKKESTLLT